jgi:hypothetical protein
VTRLLLLEETGEPMRFIEIYGKAAALLPDTALSKGAVKAFLSAEGRTRRPRFVPLQRGFISRAV